jgi:ribosomal protein L17
MSQEEERHLTERTGNVTSQQTPSQSSSKKTAFAGDTKEVETTPLRKKKHAGVVETIENSGKKINQVSHAAASVIKSNAKTLAKSVNLNNVAKSYDEKKVGMGGIAKKVMKESDQIGIEEHEAVVRKIVQPCWITQFLTTLLSSVLVFVVYLISIETIMSCALTVGLTLFWYDKVSLDIDGPGFFIFQNRLASLVLFTYY